MMTFLDIPPEYTLSANFKYRELIYSDTALARNINNNIVDRTVLDRAAYLAEEILEPLRSIYGPFSPNSWYRGEALEFAITSNDGFLKFVAKYSSSNVTALQRLLKETKSLESLYHNARQGVPNAAELRDLWDQYFARKQHPKGEAADLKIRAAGSVQQLYTTLKGLNKPFDQIILEMHKPAIPMSGWVHYSIVNESLPVNLAANRTNRGSDFAIS